MLVFATLVLSGRGVLAQTGACCIPCGPTNACAEITMGNCVGTGGVFMGGACTGATCPQQDSCLSECTSTGVNFAGIVVKLDEDPPVVTFGPLTPGQVVGVQMFLRLVDDTTCLFIGGQVSATFPNGFVAHGAGYPNTPDVPLSFPDANDAICFGGSQIIEDPKVQCLLELPFRGADGMQGTEDDTYVVDPADAVCGVLTFHVDYGATPNRPEQLSGEALANTPADAAAGKVIQIALADIRVDKIVPDAVCEGTPVKITYQVTLGAGIATLSDIQIDDTGCRDIEFVSGDVKNPGLLDGPEPLIFDQNMNCQFDPGDNFVDLNGNGVWDPAETWIYTCTAIPTGRPCTATVSGRTMPAGGPSKTVMDTDTKTIMIVEPTCRIDGPTVVCPGETRQYTVTENSGIGGGKFAWEVVSGPCELVGGVTGEMVDVAFGAECGTCELRSTVQTGKCSSDCTYTVMIMDNQPPVFVDCPGANTVLACGVPTPIVITAMDNCPLAVAIECTPSPGFPGTVTGTGGNLVVTLNATGMGTITCTATDVCGNQSPCEFTVSTTCDGCCIPEVPDDEGSGSCDEANGTPCCRIERCCENVCWGEDGIIGTPDDPAPECCTVVWDQACADLAFEICTPTPNCPGEGSCFEPNGTPGCDDPECCELICMFSFFCCIVAWDAGCVEQAQVACTPMPEPPGEDEEAGDAPDGIPVLESHRGGSWFDAGTWDGGAVPGGASAVVVRDPLVIDKRGARAGDVRIGDVARPGRGAVLDIETGTLEAASIDLGGGDETAGLRLLDAAHGAMDGDLLVAAWPGSAGRVEVDGRGTSLFARGVLSVGLEGDGTLVLTSGASVTVTDAFVGVGRDARGLVVVSRSSLISLGGLDVGVDGIGELAVLDGGEVSAPEVFVGPLGLVDGDGVLLADVSNGGRIDAGAAMLAIDGSYRQEPRGVLAVRIEAASSGTLAVTRDATLSGSLRIEVADGAAPRPGERFVVLTAGRRLGAFTDVALVGVTEGLRVEIAYEPDRVTIEVGAAGAPVPPN